MLYRGSANTPEGRRERWRTPTALRLIGGLAGFSLIGMLLLMLPMMSKGEPLPMNDALFTAVSALSVTGLSTIVPVTDLTAAGKVTLMFLIQLGGVGYMVLAVLVFRILGRDVSLTDRMALQDALGLINLRGIVQLTLRVVATVVVIEALGATLLFFHWSNTGPIADKPAGYVAFYAIFHSVSSFCNAGFDLFTGRYAYPTDSVTLLIKGTLIVLGGLGIPVLFDLIVQRNTRKFSLHTKLTLKVTLGLMLWGALGLWLSESRPGHVLDGLPLWRQIELSVFQSVSCRTAGFVGMPSFESLDSASQLMIMTLMFIGCAPASMGGGITTGTFLVMVLAMVAYARRQSTPVVSGRAIPGEMVRKAAAVLTISLFAVLTSAWIIMLTHPVSFERAVFEVVSAFATCGLTLNFTSELNGVGQAVIIFMMFWGRLGALTVLFAFTGSNRSRRVRYPEEKVLIG